MSDQTNAASFKLKAIETIAADPLMKPIDVSMFIGYTRFMKWPGRMAYLTNITARVLTGNAAQATVSASRKRLVEAGYLVHTMTKSNGAAIYEINNPRVEVVDDHIHIATETLKEWDADRKARDRAKRKRASNIVTLKEREGINNWTDRASIIDDNSLDNTLDEGATREEAITSRSYQKMTGGW